MFETSVPAGARAQLAQGIRDNDDLFRFEIEDRENARESAVLALFGLLPDRTHLRAEEATADDLNLLLEVRADTLRAHPGEVSFPGGSADPGDVDAVDTALREAHEETGLDRTGVEIIATLEELPLVPNNFIVVPVVAWRTREMPLRVMDPAETHEVRLTPVAGLIDPANRFTSVFRHDRGEFRGPAFDLGGATLWGFTALVVDHLLTVAGWSVPWDEDDERDIFTLR